MKRRLADIMERPVFHVLLILCIGAIVYSNTLHVPFHEDTRFIIENPFVKDIGFPIETLRHDKELYSHLHHRYIGLLTFALNYRLHGFDVVGYHIFNIFVHLLTALLLYAFTAAMLKTPLLESSIRKGPRLPLPLLAALLFIAHPIQTESVNFIWQRPTVMAAFFYLLSAVTYLRSRIETEGIWKNRLFYALSVLAAAVAMKTKQNAFTLPFMLGLIELYFFDGNLKSRAVRLIPFALTLLIIPLTSYFVMGYTTGQSTTGVAPGPLMYYPRAEYLLTQFTAVARYIRLLVLPVNQIFHHLDYPLYKSFFENGVASSFAFLAAIFGLALFLLIRFKRTNADCVLTGFGIVWFFVTLSVESSVFPIGILSAEYRVYLPSAGFFIACVSFAGLIISRFGSVNRQALLGGAFLVVIAFGGAAYLRNEAWKSEVSLWQADMKRMPGFPMGHYLLAEAYQRDGMTAEAEREYGLAARLDEEQHQSGREPGIRERVPERINELKRALKQDDAGSHFRLAVEYYLDKQYDNALRELDAAIKINSGQEGAYYYRGLVYHEQGRYVEAIREYRSALKINAGSFITRTNLGGVYAQLGRYSEAINEVKAALLANPDYAEAHRYLGLIYQDNGRLEDAAGELAKAVRLKPDYAEAHNNLGEVLFQMGKNEEAFRECRIALDLKPDLAAARDNLYRILQKGGYNFR